MKILFMGTAAAEGVPALFCNAAIAGMLGNTAAKKFGAGAAL